MGGFRGFGVFGNNPRVGGTKAKGNDNAMYLGFFLEEHTNLSANGAPQEEHEWKKKQAKKNREEKRCV